MLQVRNLSNKYQKRLIRPKYAQTQATPYAAVLHPALRNSDGSFKPITAGGSGATVPGLTYTVAPFTLQGGLVPGTVMIKGPGETVLPATGIAGGAEVPFGLLGNFVGGTLDDIRDENSVGVWRGVDSTYELLAPAFDDTGLATAYANATPGQPVKLYAGTDGRLTATNPGTAIVVATLIERVSASVIYIDLKI